MDYKKMKDRIDKWFDSEEGQKYLEEFNLKLQKSEDFRQRWDLKIKNFYLKNTDNFDGLIGKLLIHDNKASDRLWKKGSDGQSKLIWRVMESLEEFGQLFEEKDFEVFTSHGYFLNGYRFEVISGQGSFVRIYKI